jgi:hypothetical protein
MPRKVGTNQDLTGNQLLNARFQNLASAPTGTAGLFYYDTAKKLFGFYNGSAWIYPTEGGGAEASGSTLGTIKTTGDLGGTGSAPTVVHFTLSSEGNANSQKIVNLAEPTNPQDSATKNYVDNKVNGLSWKQPVRAATTAALAAVTGAGSGATRTLTANSNGILEVDGAQITVLGQRVLVKNQATGSDNGIYTLTTKGEAGAKFVLTRAADATSEAQLVQATMLIEEGTTNKDTVWSLSNAPGFTVDTTALVFVEIQSATTITGDSKYTTRTGNVMEIKANTTVPVEPAENAVSAEGEGVPRKKTFRLRGNASATEFTLTHNLNTRLLIVQGQENSGGTPTVPIELDWEPSSANAVVIKFPEAPAKPTNFFITILG